MTNKDLESLFEQMTSFYLEHVPEDATYLVWLEELIETYKALRDEVKYVDGTTLPSTSPTLRTIPYYEIDPSSGVYDKATAKDLVERQKKGCRFLIYDLEEMGYFINLEFLTNKTETPHVYDLELYFDFEKKSKLEYKKDYFIRRNKLFLLPTFIKDNTRIIGKMHAYNIKINDYTIERNWGDNFPIRVPFMMSRNRYRTFVEAYTRLMNSSYFISDMKEAIKTVTRNNNIDIYDIASREIPESFKRLYDEYRLSPLDFIVRLDEPELFDKIQTNIILHMIMNTKEEQTYFWLFFSLLRLDEMEAEDDFWIKVFFERIEILEGDEEVDMFFYKKYEDEFFCNPYYDGKMRAYDFGDIPYDDDKNRCMEITMEGRFDDPYINMDESENSVVAMDSRESISYENFEIKVVNHPEIPRGFKVMNNSIYFDKNKGKTDAYQIFGSADGKLFQLIGEVFQDEISDNAAFSIANAKASGIRYYKIRSRERTHHSFFTLIKGG